MSEENIAVYILLMAVAGMVYTIQQIIEVKKEIKKLKLKKRRI